MIYRLVNFEVLTCCLKTFCTRIDLIIVDVLVCDRPLCLINRTKSKLSLITILDIMLESYLETDVALLLSGIFIKALEGS